MMNHWKILPGGYGQRLAVNGKLTAAASHERMFIWENDELVAIVERPNALPGYPRISNDKVYWGDGYYNLNNRRFEQLFHFEKKLLADANPFPGGGFMPVTYEWNIEGQLMAASFQWNGNEKNNSQVILVNMLSREQSIIWQENDAAPSAIHISKSYIILGSREPVVLDHTGKKLYSLHAKLPPFRIACTSDEKYLMMAGHASIDIWNMETKELVRQWTGKWLDASISPDGKNLVMVDFEGNLHVESAGEKTVQTKMIIPPDPIQNISMDHETLIASFARGEKIRPTSI